MAADRRLRLRALLASGEHEEPSVLARICALAVSRVGVSGASVTLIRRAGSAEVRQHLAQASNPLAARLEDLILTTGEGPGVSSVAVGAPVLVPDLSAAVRRWPAFAPEALAEGAAAVFAFPLQMGAIRLGTLDCHRETVGVLNQDQVSDALVLAELAVQAVLTEVEGHTVDDLGWITDVHAVVHQASGIVMYQLGISIEAALVRLRAYSYARGLPLVEVAHRIVDRQLRLESDP